ncbi:hypothetical protein [Acetohalobium arabaticum]|nr:hypothetical protein [Acetohalobium arabaticum]
MASFFKLTTITKNPITSIVILHITATVYGIVMGYLLYYFYQRWGPVLE